MPKVSRRGFYEGDLAGGGKIVFFVQGNHALSTYIFDVAMQQADFGGGAIAEQRDVFAYDRGRSRARRDGYQDDGERDVKHHQCDGDDALVFLEVVMISAAASRRLLTALALRSTSNS